MSSNTVDELFEAVDNMYNIVHEFRQGIRHKTIPQEDLRRVFEHIAEHTEGEVYEGYSGRCMYGEKCWGVSGNLAHILEVAGSLGLQQARYDNLGCESIVYWPNIPYMEDESEDNEED